MSAVRAALQKVKTAPLPLPGYPRWLRLYGIMGSSNVATIVTMWQEIQKQYQYHRFNTYQCTIQCVICGRTQCFLGTKNIREFFGGAINVYPQPADGC